MTRIRVKDVCQTTRVFRVDGQRLRDAIEQAWNDQGPSRSDPHTFPLSLSPTHAMLEVRCVREREPTWKPSEASRSTSRDG
jgi:hypothetical protein